MSSTPALAVFHERVAAHARSLPAEAAGAWLVEHGLFARGIRERLPREIAEGVAVAARGNLAKNLHWISAFERLVEALGAAPDPIPVCPLKGIALLHTVYAEEPEARLLTDLDVLVPEERIEAALGRLAERLGVHETASSRAVRGDRHERTVEGDRLAVDLHTRLGVGAARSAGYTVLATVTRELRGQRLRFLDEPETLVFQIGHLVRHGPFARLAWAEDVLRVAAALELGRGPERALHDLVDAAARLGARRELLAGVAALRWLVGPQFLAGFERSFSAADRRHASWCETALWRRQRRHPLGVAAIGPLRRFASVLLLAESSRDAAALATSRVREVVRRSRSSS